MTNEDKQQRDALVEALARIDAREAARTDILHPLQPGETVTIPDAVIAGDTIMLHGNGDIDVLYLEPYTVDSCPRIALDAAGVRQLRDACTRWLAAQESHS